MLCCRAAGKSKVPDWVLVMQCALNMFNAMYFQDRVVANSAVVAWCAENKIDKRETEAATRAARAGRGGKGGAKGD